MLSIQKSAKNAIKMNVNVFFCSFVCEFETIIYVSPTETV